MSTRDTSALPNIKCRGVYKALTVETRTKKWNSPFSGNYKSFLIKVLILLALFGNLMVCIAILWDRRLRKQSENLFLLSLAISDIGVSVLVMFFAAVNDINQAWIFGPVYCKLWISFDITCCTASILNLAAISLDRYWHISNPMQYIQVMNHRRTAYICLLLWVMSAGLGSVQVLMGSGVDNDPTHNGTKCVMELHPAYAIVSSTVSFFLPAAIMVFLYTKLYLYARAHARSIRSQLQAVTGVLMVASPHMSHAPSVAHNKDEEDGQLAVNHNSYSTSRRPTVCSSEDALREHSNCTAVHASIAQKAREARDKEAAGETDSLTNKADTIATRQLMQQNAAKKHKNDNKEASDQKARVTLGVIMGTFLLCWLPFFCSNIITSFTHFPAPVFVIFTWCGYANSSANPIIYSIFNRDFRRAFHRILLKCCEVCSCCAKCCKQRMQPGNGKRSWRGGPAARYQAGTPANVAASSAGANCGAAGGAGGSDSKPAGTSKMPSVIARFSKKSTRNGTRSGGIRVEDGDEEEEVRKPMNQQPQPQVVLVSPTVVITSGGQGGTSPTRTTHVTINNVGQVSVADVAPTIDVENSNSSSSPNGSTHRFKPVEVIATV